jgi:hypothetical protein
LGENFGEESRIGELRETYPKLMELFVGSGMVAPAAFVIFRLFTTASGNQPSAKISLAASQLSA